MGGISIGGGRIDPGFGLTSLIVVLAATGAIAAPAHAQLAFSDVSATAGVQQAGMLTESVAWGDYDGDGDQDLYLTNDGDNALFRNDGGDSFTDVTATALVAGGGTFSVGACFGDLDNDGDLDLYVVNFGGGDRDLLYRNDGAIGLGGETVFSEIAATSGIDFTASSRPCALLDYDRDGLLDVFLMSLGPNILYRNLGGMQFENVATDVGVDQDVTGVGIVATDVDDDGDLDVFTGNRSMDINALFVNGNGVFTDIAAGAGITKTGLGMGVLSFDYDNDLDFDLYWTTWPPATNALYENLGGASFDDVGAASGTDDPNGWGISVNAGDVDNDGWLDFFVTNGFDASTTPNVLFLNDQDGTFSDASGALQGGVAFDGRGVAFADYDEDGDLDLVVTSDSDTTTRLWRNDSVTAHHWIGLKLEGTVSNRSAIGAHVTVTSSLGATTVQEVSGGAGRGSQNSLPLEFGLGTASGPVDITIRWPSGQVQSLTAVEPDQYFEVIEPLTVPTIALLGATMLVLALAAIGMLRAGATGESLG